MRSLLSKLSKLKGVVIRHPIFLLHHPPLFEVACVSTIHGTNFVSHKLLSENNNSNSFVETRKFFSEEGNDHDDTNDAANSKKSEQSDDSGSSRFGSQNDHNQNEDSGSGSSGAEDNKQTSLGWYKDLFGILWPIFIVCLLYCIDRKRMKTKERKLMKAINGLFYEAKVNKISSLAKVDPLRTDKDRYYIMLLLLLNVLYANLLSEFVSDYPDLKNKKTKKVTTIVDIWGNISKLTLLEENNILSQSKKQLVFDEIDQILEKYRVSFEKKEVHELIHGKTELNLVIATRILSVLLLENYLTHYIEINNRNILDYSFPPRGGKFRMKWNIKKLEGIIRIEGMHTRLLELELVNDWDKLSKFPRTFLNTSMKTTHKMIEELFEDAKSLKSEHEKGMVARLWDAFYERNDKT